MKLSLIGLVLRQLRGSLRHSYWSHLLSAVIMALTLFALGGFMLFELNLAHILSGWGGQIRIIAYLRPPVETGDVEKLLERVQALPEVQQVRYTSSAQAWRDFQTTLGSQAGLLEGLPRDVLPASLEVTLKNEQPDSRIAEQVAERLKAEKEVDSVEYPQQWAEKLGLITLAVDWGRWIIGGVLFTAAFFIVSSAVKLMILARKNEIDILQLLGASAALIESPFLLEGVLHGLAGASIALAGLWGVYRIVGEQMQSLGGLLSPLGEIEFLDLQRTSLLVATGLVLGTVSSVFSVKRLVRTWRAANARR